MSYTWTPNYDRKDTCPNCGYCKHCGRGNQPPAYVPQIGNYPYITWWQQPVSSNRITFTVDSKVIGSYLADASRGAK